MEKKPIISLVSAMVCTRNITDAVIEIKEEYGDIFEFKLYFVNEINQQPKIQDQFRKDIVNSHTLMIDIRGHNKTVEIILNTLKNLKREKPANYEKKNIISLVGGNQEIRELTRIGSFDASKIPSGGSEEYGFEKIPELTDLVKKGIRISNTMAKIGKYFPFGMLKHLRNWMRIMDYWVYGHSGVPENFTYMLLMILKEYAGLNKPKIKKIPSPQKIPEYGIFDPILNQYFSSLDQYLQVKKYNEDKQTIGIFYYGGIYFEQSIPVLKQFMHQFSEYNVIPVFSETLENITALEEFFMNENGPLVDTVINLQYFQINGGPFGGDNSITLDLYERLNVPQFNPIINYDMKASEYLDSDKGIIPINQVIAIVMPELDGRIEMMCAGYMRSMGLSNEINSEVLDIQPYEKNIEFITERIRNWLRLRKRSNQQKKIAFIIYDYPPGEDRFANASYLDVFSSLVRILSRLEKQGYKLGKLSDELDKFNKEEKGIEEIFLNNGAINTPKHMSSSSFNGISLDRKTYSKLLENVPTSLQEEINQQWGDPPGDIMTNTHTIKLPLLEYGNIILGVQPARTQIKQDIEAYHDKEIPPHHQYIAFYKYLEEIANVDAIVHVGTHGTLEFLPGKESCGHYLDYCQFVQGSIPNIYLYHITNTSEAAIAKRRSNAVIINHSSPKLQISGLNEKFSLLENLLDEYTQLTRSGQKWDEDKQRKTQFHEETIQDLEKEIWNACKKLNIEAKSIEDIEKILYRYTRSTIPNGLHVFGERFEGNDKAEMILNILLHSGDVPESIEDVLKNIDLSDQNTLQILKNFINSQIGEQTAKIHSSKSLSALKSEEKDEIGQWIRIQSKKMRNCREMENLERALSGKFIMPGIGGDPIRNPDVFPTGRNSFGFDPRLIPSTIATKRGDQIAEELLQKYYESHQEYPQTVSVVLWAFETMKTGGETIGQIFNYLGVKPVKEKSIWTTELELIPLEEMNHPRIDVVITICGIFRDTFPNLINLIDEAVELVANAEENHEQNFIRKSNFHHKKIKDNSRNGRIFGPPPGRYNTNLTDIINKKTWKDEEELAEDYLTNMCYQYRKNVNGVKALKEFKESLSGVKMTSQVRDSAEFHITDLDHYFEFTGGLTKAYEDLTGEDLEIYIADSASKEINISKIEDSIKEGAITRNLNKKWIEGMLEHKFHGTQKVAERVENLLGLDATTHKVKNHIWEESFETYVKNEEIKNRLVENNHFAMMDMIESFLDAEKRGYWETSQNNIDELKKLYLELDNWVEMEYSNSQSE